MIGGLGDGQVEVDVGPVGELRGGEPEVVELRQVIQGEVGPAALMAGLGVLGVFLGQGVSRARAWSGSPRASCIVATRAGPRPSCGANSRDRK